MSAVLSRTLLLAALIPVAACDLYMRGGGSSDDVVPPPDSGGLPDAQADVDAELPIDAPDVPPPNPGFVTPTSTTHANVLRNGGWMDVGTADWSCLAQPPNETVPATGYTLSGTVREVASSQAAGGVGIVVTAAGQTLVSGTSSTDGGSRGTYRLTIPALPAGVTRLRFEQSAGAERKTIAIDRYLGQLPITTLDLPIVSGQTATAWPQAVGAQVSDTDGFVVGEVRDCQGRQVSGAIVALSTSATLVVHWPGGETYYFPAGGNNQPARHEVRTQTNSDGRFVLLGADASSQVGVEGVVQAWGFQTDSDRAAGAVKLLGKSQAVIEASTASSVLIGRTRLFGTAP